MRQLTDANRLRRFMRALGAEATSAGRVLPDRRRECGAVRLAPVETWTEAHASPGVTIDIDLKLESTTEALLRVIPRLKDSLQLNIELASPGDFIPELPGWPERSVFIVREGKVDFFHHDFYGQALSGTERGHVRDLDDVVQMARHGLIVPARLHSLFETIAPELYRYPAIHAASFRRAVESATARLENVGS